MYRRNRLLAVIVTLASLMPAAPGVAQDRVETIVEQEGSEMRVSLRPKDLTWRRLVEVSRRLRARHPDWEGQIWFFTAPWAAQTFTISAVADPPPSPETYRHLRAIYFYDRTTRREYLDLFLFGWDGEIVRESRVELFDSAPSRCRDEVARRCVLVLEDLPALPNGISGMAVVTARITRGGQLTDARVVDTEFEPRAESPRVARMILQSLRSWRLEPDSQASNIRIVFSLGARARQPQPTGSELALETPGGVHISAGPR